MENIIIAYAAGVNLLSFCLFGIDKQKAKKKKWRISEKTLLLSAAIGGSLGAIAGMYRFHHKTKKPVFSIGIPVILIMQAVLLYAFGRIAGMR